jgi:hypothetical protein
LDSEICSTDSRLAQNRLLVAREQNVNSEILFSYLLPGVVVAFLERLILNFLMPAIIVILTVHPVVTFVILTTWPSVNTVKGCTKAPWSMALFIVLLKFLLRLSRFTNLLAGGVPEHRRALELSNF